MEGRRESQIQFKTGHFAHQLPLYKRLYSRTSEGMESGQHTLAALKWCSTGNITLYIPYTLQTVVPEAQIFVFHNFPSYLWTYFSSLQTDEQQLTW